MAKLKFDMAKSFKRDLRKHYLALIGEAWTEVSNCLLNGLPIPEKYQDHPLKGDKSGLRDCHIKPDIVVMCVKFSITVFTLLSLHRLTLMACSAIILIKP